MEQFDEDGYPTEEFLKYVTDFDLVDNDVWELIGEIESAWWSSDWGFKLKRAYRDKLFNRKYRGLELHTGGWSGNEDIIRALGSNLLFFALYWQKTYVGGHYYFKITIK